MIVQFTIFLTVYFALDALHDKFLLEARPVIKDRSKDRYWHQIDSIIKGGVAIVFLYLSGMYGYPTMLEASIEYGLYGAYFMAFRAVWFNLCLNFLRPGVKTFHLSKSGIEGYIAEKFSPTAYWMISIIGLIGLAVVIIYKQRMI